MTKTSFLYIILICLLLPGYARAQQKNRYNFFTYNVNDGLLQSNVADIAFDQNNFCWLSFANGIQKFDGNRFIDIPLQPGLPDDKSVSFFRQKNGDLLFIHSAGISLYDIRRDVFTQVYSQPPATSGRLRVLGENNGLLLLLNESGIITALNEQSFNRVYSVSTGLRYDPAIHDQPVFFSAIEHEKIHIFFNHRIYQWQLVEKRMTDSSTIIPGIKPYFLGNLDDEAFFFSVENGTRLQKYNYTTRTISTVYKSNIVSPKSFRGQMINWNNKKILSIYNRLYEMSDGFDTVLAEIVDFKNNVILGNAAAAKVARDNFDNLFLVTINDGIKKLVKNSYPVKYFGAGDPAENYILSIYADKPNNKILAGTYGGGLLVFDTSQNLIKHIKAIPGSGSGFSVNAITKNTAGDYILLIPFQKHACLLGKNLDRISPLAVQREDGKEAEPARYYGSKISEGQNGAILQTQDLIYLVNKNNNTILQKTLPSKAATISSVLFGNTLVTHTTDQLFFMDTTRFETIQKLSFPNTGGVRCFYADDKNIWLGTNKGIFIIDGKGRIIKQYNKSNGLPDECIYAIAIDESKNIWCSTNKGITRVSATGNIMQLTKKDGLQENEFNTNVVFITPEKELYFGGINGVNSFYPKAIPDYMVDVTVYLTGLSINNEPLKDMTAIWYLKKIALPYNRNSLALEFIASGPQNSNQYIHQYKMEGVDKEWIQNPGMQAVRYHLSPGRYIFKMYVSSYFEKEAVALKELIIIVKPPFWKTWWFISLLALAVIALIIYLVNLYNRTRYRKKMELLKTRQKIQEERERISMELHDSIGAYANAVLYNTELLQGEEDENGRKKLMKDLRFASKDIITSLRETIWALKNDNYSAQECLLRIRNFIHPFSRYYPGIQFRVEGEASDEKELHYALALNVVRVVQEAVNNAVKHSGAGNIIINSSISGSEWLLEIKDDGAGFDMAGAEYGNGIANMQKRAQESGFHLQLTSAETKGTQISIRVP